MELDKYLNKKYGYNRPIYIEDVLFEGYSRPWVFKELKKMIDCGKIKRYATGIYYFPQKLPWGESKLNPREIVNRRFISDGNDVYGYIAGLSLLNMVALSTQVPNLVEVVTNKESTRVRDIMIGPQRIRARRSRTAVTKENASTLQFLDLMNSITPSQMDETERYMLRKYVKTIGVKRDAVAKYASLFPAKAMKNMLEGGVVYELT